jgi:hypothetical protein
LQKAGEIMPYTIDDGGGSHSTPPEPQQTVLQNLLVWLLNLAEPVIQQAVQIVETGQVSLPPSPPPSAPTSPTETVTTQETDAEQEKRPKRPAAQQLLDIGELLLWDIPQSVLQATRNEPEIVQAVLLGGLPAEDAIRVLFADDTNIISGEGSKFLLEQNSGTEGRSLLSMAWSSRILTPGMPGLGYLLGEPPRQGGGYPGYPENETPDTGQVVYIRLQEQIADGNVTAEQIESLWALADQYQEAGQAYNPALAALYAIAFAGPQDATDFIKATGFHYYEGQGGQCTMLSSAAGYESGLPTTTEWGLGELSYMTGYPKEDRYKGYPGTPAFTTVASQRTATIHIAQAGVYNVGIVEYIFNYDSLKEANVHLPSDFSDPNIQKPYGSTETGDFYTTIQPGDRVYSFASDCPKDDPTCVRADFFDPNNHVGTVVGWGPANSKQGSWFATIEEARNFYQGTPNVELIPWAVDNREPAPRPYTEIKTEPIISFLHIEETHSE